MGSDLHRFQSLYLWDDQGYVQFFHTCTLLNYFSLTEYCWWPILILPSQQLVNPYFSQHSLIFPYVSQINCQSVDYSCKVIKKRIKIGTNDSRNPACNDSSGLRENKPITTKKNRIIMLSQASINTEHKDSRLQIHTKPQVLWTYLHGPSIEQRIK